MPRLLAAALLLILSTSALAHDHWINRGQYKSPVDGSYCCGAADCAVVDPDDVNEVRGGYSLRGLMTYGVGRGARNQWLDETVPFREVQPSRDGQYWRCKKPDGSRRCFFGPPPSL